ncbi:MAG TPA: alpha/beta hydrolase family protein [Capsulimonadaceae bacterium]|nr:alpha/beta hydrolase family protein [Capsulimonadaceae bacterium]
MERFFSPSQYHEAALKELRPSLSYRGQEFETWQKELRSAFCEKFGWDDRRIRVPLNVEEIERDETDSYIRRKLVFTSEPGSDVPCHLLVPKKAKMPAPAMICIQGHASGMHISIGQKKYPEDERSLEGDRDFALQAVREGYVALALESRAFCERAETLQKQRSQHGCEDAAMHALLLGRPLACERAWDVSRAIDFLETIPEVDSDRIGCMGNSGGGTTTFYAACVDNRIKLALPSCSFCTYADSIFRIYHCTDNFIPGIMTVADVGDLAGLIAPRKLLIVAGRDDEIFPIEGVKKAFEKARQIYRAAGQPQNIRLIVGEGGHRFYAAPTWPVVREWL